MKIEAVVVCVNYSDFLDYTLRENIAQLDRVVIVTHPDDKKTQGVASRYSADIVQSNVCHEEGDKFNKGRMINVGFSHLKGGEGVWYLHLDADILLPHGFRQMLARARLNPKNIYGADRCNVYGFETFMEHRHKLIPHYAHQHFVEPPREFPLGARIIHKEHNWTPLGFFQLFYSRPVRKYPYHQGNAEHTDVLFSIQWPREQRVLLPEVIVYHLDSTEGPRPMGANWNGRQTPQFAPKLRRTEQPELFNCHEVQSAHEHKGHGKAHDLHPRPYTPTF